MWHALYMVESVTVYEIPVGIVLSIGISTVCYAQLNSLWLDHVTRPAALAFLAHNDLTCQQTCPVWYAATANL